jgi:hypothetical protein
MDSQQDYSLTVTGNLNEVSSIILEGSCSEPSSYELTIIGASIDIEIFDNNGVQLGVIEDCAISLNLRQRPDYGRLAGTFCGEQVEFVQD